MKLTITKFIALFVLVCCLASCGQSITSDQLLTINMYGLSKAPASATGDQDPNFQIYQILAVELISVDATTSTVLFSNEQDLQFRVIDREQIVFSKEIKELVGISYSGIKVTLSPTVIGGNKRSGDLSFTLAQPILTLSQVFPVETAKSIELYVKISWGNTISSSAMSEPDFALSIP